MLADIMEAMIFDPVMANDESMTATFAGGSPAPNAADDAAAVSGSRMAPRKDDPETFCRPCHPADRDRAADESYDESCASAGSLPDADWRGLHSIEPSDAHLRSSHELKDRQLDGLWLWLDSLDGQLESSPRCPFEARCGCATRRPFGFWLRFAMRRGDAVAVRYDAAYKELFSYDEVLHLLRLRATHFEL